MTEPTRKQRVRAALRGEPTDRIACGPLAVHFCARYAGVTCRDYTSDPRVLADCVVRTFDAFRPDAIWLSADTWVTAEAMGAPVAFPAGDLPLGGTGEPAIRTAADVDAIPAADPGSRGRMPHMLEALGHVKDAIGEDAFVVACFDQSPLTLACALVGMSELMVRLYDDLPFVQAVMERAVEHAAAYGVALADAGADMLSTGDSAAGLVGPKFYRDVALPAEQSIFTRLRTHTDAPLSLHICGDTSRLLADMAASGADVLEIDHRVPMAEACRMVPPDVALWGNVDPVGVLERGTPESIREAVDAVAQDVRDAGRTRFVLSTGCTITPDTPADNLHAFLLSAR